jgi:hypothetical protein
MKMLNNDFNKTERVSFNIGESGHRKDISRLVIEGLENLERGLKIIGENVDFGVVKIFLLGIDSIGRLIILEVFEKEDEILFLKIVDNFDWVFNHMEEIQKRFNSFDIDVSLSPRTIIILPHFSAAFLRRITYISHIGLQLYAYRILNNSVPERVTFELVSYSSQRKFSKDLEERTVGDLMGYIETPAIKVFCQKVVEDIQKTLPQLRLVTANGYISFQDKEREWFGIYPHRNFFWFNISKGAWNGIYVNNQSSLDNILREIEKSRRRS